MKKIIFTIVIASGLLLTACYKAPEDGIAKIIVVDTNDFRVPTANITLTGPTGSFINVSGISNFNGEWIYTHDPALEVILNVNATSQDGLQTGYGIIRIKPDETATTIIKIQ